MKYLNYEGLLEFKNQLDNSLDDKVDKVTGKGLSTNDFTTDLKNKLDNIEAGATANEGTVTGITIGQTDYIPIDGQITLPNYPTTFGASGTNHSSGLVPDPGTTQGSTKYLREDGTWAEPASSSSSSSSPIYFGECNSEAFAQAKVATVDNNFTLYNGVIIGIKFLNSNTFSATATDVITLNVNNTGAKLIYYSVSDTNTGTSTIIYGLANRYIYYTYNEDDDVWLWMSHGADTNSTYSAGTAALLTAGTNTTNRTWQAKILHDYMSYPNLIYNLGTQSKSGALTIDGSIPLHVITCTGNISSVALSTNPAAGHSCHVIFAATAARTVSIAHNATNRVCPEAKAVTLNITANGYVEVDFLNANNKIYVRGV